MTIQGTMDSIAARVAADGLQGLCQWRRRTLPPAVIGEGCGTLAHKVNKVIRRVRLESGPENLDDRLLTVVGWLADQGAEIAIGDGVKDGRRASEAAARVRDDQETWLSAELPCSYLFPKILDNTGSSSCSLQYAGGSSSVVSRIAPL